VARYLTVTLDAWQSEVKGEAAPRGPGDRAVVAGLHSLATGKTGTLALTTALGLQHLTVHNLRSYQTANCDDYWNWGWWAAGHADATGQLE